MIRGEGMTPEAARLYEAAAELRIVDVHEHLGPETPLDMDLCRLIAHDNYLCTDLAAAGMDPAAMGRLADLEVPEEERWRSLSPFWQRVRFGAYARGLVYSLDALYGIGGLSARDLGVQEAAVAAASERLRADYATPGIFRRVLHDACRIDEVYTQGEPVDCGQPQFRWLARPLDRADFSPGGAFAQDARSLGLVVRTAEGLRAAMDAILSRFRERGACGFKIAALPWAEPTEQEVSEALRAASSGRRRNLPTQPPEQAYQAYMESTPLVRLYVSRIAARAAEFDLPVAVHAGAPWTSWQDYRVWEPTAIIPLLLRYRETRFDLYHAGFPWGTPTSMLGKAFPNVWQDLSWAHLMSPELAVRSVGEWLDLVPVNKVLGFGGDFRNETVVLVAGHLELARRNLATALGRRVSEGTMGDEEARDIHRLWLADNPRTLYRSGGMNGFTS